MDTKRTTYSRDGHPVEVVRSYYEDGTEFAVIRYLDGFTPGPVGGRVAGTEDAPLWEHRVKDGKVVNSNDDYYYPERWVNEPGLIVVEPSDFGARGAIYSWHVVDGAGNELYECSTRVACEAFVEGFALAQARAEVLGIDEAATAELTTDQSVERCRNVCAGIRRSLSHAKQPGTVARLKAELVAAEARLAKLTKAGC